MTPHTATLAGEVHAMTPCSETDPRFDVVIVNARTGIVSSIAGYSLPQYGGIRQGAKSLLDSLDDRLREPFIAMIQPAGEAQKGQPIILPILLPDTATPAPKPHRERHPGKSTIQRRMEDVTCILCGSPNLLNRLYCAECSEAENSRRRSSYKAGLPAREGA